MKVQEGEESDQKKRKVAKTMLEVHFDPSKTKERRRRVAKTMLEADMAKPDINVLMNLAAKAAAEQASVQAENQAENNTSPAEQDHSVGGKKPRRVAKTILENEVPRLAETAKPERKKTRRIAKTLVTTDISGIVAKAAEFNEQALSQTQKTKQPVAKTMLDHDALNLAVSQSFVLKEARIKETIKAKALEPQPQIEPIPCHKKALPCPWKWTEAEGRERFRYCQRCQTPVYHLEGLQTEQIDALILQRENLEKYTLYKRSDGKYMTRDCPEEVKHKREKLMLIAGIAAFALVVVALFVIFPPSPPPPTKTVSEEQDKPRESAENTLEQSRPQSGAGSKIRSSGTFHYDVDAPDAASVLKAPPVAAPGSALPETPESTPTYTKEDETGEFWKEEKNEGIESTGQYPTSPRP
ncbi:MAG: hypothetical protein K2Y32_01010 [Candidatus Obscuribacterales bacterium]|nr:hypothetical protein [Candidatus Obscuribacterales bacterium]